LAADYSLTLPGALPASDSFVVSDVAGNLSFQSTSFALPAGVMMMYGGTSAPTGWLFCNGSVVSQATYANLYAAIGTAFNTGGEGAGNFRLPDMRRRVPMGAGGTGSGTIGNAVGNSGGSETVTLTTANLPSTATTTSAGTHTHNILYNISSGSSPSDGTAISFTTRLGTVTDYRSNVNSVYNFNQSAGAHTHTISGATDTPTNIVQSSLVLNYIIKY
jgi:microcystin-dependent protein